MRRGLVAAVLVAFVVLAHAEVEDDEDVELVTDVVVLTDDTFKSFLAENPVALVEFYAPWCGHCKSLVPEYERLATMLKGLYPIAKLDATENRQTAQAMEVQGFPTIKLFLDGEPIDYRGARTAEAMQTFITKSLQPSSIVLSTKDELELAKATKPLLVGVFPADDAADTALTEFRELARVTSMEEDTTFGVAFQDSEAAKALQLESEQLPAFVLFWEESQAVFKGEFSKAALMTWAHVEALPTLGEIGPTNFKRYVEAGLPMAWLTARSDSDNTELFGWMSEVAAQFKGRVMVVWLDLVQYAGRAKQLGLIGETSPEIGLEDPKTQLKYVYTEPEFTAEGVRAWLESFVSGELLPFVKSEPIPEDDGTALKQVVGKSFDDIVLDPTKTVLVEFYAPWCGHCKQLEPIYIELAEKVKEEGPENVVIARINVPDNDVSPSLGIRGFPTIMLFRAANKAPLTYSGERDLESLYAFVVENAGADEKAEAEEADKEEL